NRGARAPSPSPCRSRTTHRSPTRATRQRSRTRGSTPTWELQDREAASQHEGLTESPRIWGERGWPPKDPVTSDVTVRRCWGERRAAVPNQTTPEQLGALVSEPSRKDPPSMEITTSPHRPASTPWGRLFAIVVILGPVTILVLLPIGLGL